VYYAEIFGLNSPPHPGKVQIPHPREGLLRQISLLPRERTRQMLVAYEFVSGIRLVGGRVQRTVLTLETD